MKKIISMILVLGLLVTGFSLSIDAFGGPKGGNNGVQTTKGYNQNDVQRNFYNNPLDLDDSQMEKMNEARNDFFEKREDLQSELQGLNSELKELVMENADDEEIATIRTKINNLQSELENSRVNYWNQVKNILTEEQIAEMNNNFNRGRQNFGNNRSNRNNCNW